MEQDEDEIELSFDLGNDENDDDADWGDADSGFDPFEPKHNMPTPPAASHPNPSSARHRRLSIGPLPGEEEDEAMSLGLSSSCPPLEDAVGQSLESVVLSSHQTSAQPFVVRDGGGEADRAPRPRKRTVGVKPPKDGFSPRKRLSSNFDRDYQATMDQYGYDSEDVIDDVRDEGEFSTGQRLAQKEVNQRKKMR